MTTRRTESLLDAAERVLMANDTGLFISPGPRQYPAQWNWDVAFVVMGLAHFDPHRARQEVRALLSGQWRNGMVPHILFHRQVADYFPGPATWGRTSQMPDVSTSGLTQPPLLATAVARLHRLQPDLGFLADVVPSIDRWHRWFHRWRRPGGDLVHILHPWESGMDNSPRFDGALASVPASPEVFRRRDRDHVSPDQRPTDDDYQAYLSIVKGLRSCGYGPPVGTAVFEVGDVLLTSVLARAERDLAMLWQEVGGDGAPCRQRAADLERAIDLAWDPSLGMFRDRGCEPRPTVGGLLGFFALPRHPDSGRLVETLTDPTGFGPSSEAPWYPTSVPKSDPGFDPRRYWRGPVWANINWLLVDTLERGGHEEAASRLRRATIDLVAQNGFWEYYDPFTGQGLGSDSFSWTAAVVIDLLTAPKTDSGGQSVS